MLRKKARRSREWSKNNKLIDFEKAKEIRRKNREEIIKAQQEAEEEPSRRETSKKNRKRNFYSAVLVIIVAVIGFSVYNVFSVNHRLADVLAEKEALEREKEQLIYELQNADNPDYIEQRARMALRMIRPGEIYYIVPEDSE